MPMEILHNLCLIISEKTFSSLNRQKKAFRFLPEKQHLGKSKTYDLIIEKSEVDSLTKVNNEVIISCRTQIFSFLHKVTLESLE